MNHSDSERLATFLEQKGFDLSADIEKADLIIMNTCGVRKAAEDRVYSIIHNLRKKLGTETKIVMTGCIAHRPDVQKRMQSKVDLFFSINDLKMFENWIIGNCLEIAEQKNDLSTNENIAYLSINPKYTNEFQANVPIMTGCNNFCAYCVVPYARGREVSRPAEEIITEVENLVAQGYKSITLLGQNVNSYCGTWRAKQISFAQLLTKLNKIPGQFWLQFVSSHPKDMSEELIEVVTKSRKICEWIHLPIQAGNDEVLRCMNRQYTSAHYLKLLAKIKQSFAKNKPGIPFAISSDIIVGFPGETAEQFADSEKIMRKAKFDMVYFGQFSPRPSTAAWKMPDNVSSAEKERREFVLNEILKKTSAANNRKYLNQKIEILIEKKKDGAYFGKTRTQKNVKIVTVKKLIVGDFAKVRITKANIWSLEGKI